MANPQDDLEALKAQVASLTARIYMLEQRLGVAAPPSSQPVRPVAAEPQKPLSPAATAPPSAPLPHPPLVAPVAVKPKTDLEKRIGQYWLNRIGIVAVLIGVSYFLKWAFDNNLIGPAGRVLIGILLGIGLVLWSERFRTRGHAPFSYSLKAVGIGSLYLSFWAAAQYFDPAVISVEVAFIAMAVVTASTITMALTQDAQLLAAFALIGGFSTPALLSTGQNREIVLFSYVCLLDLAILVIAVFKPWRRLLWGSFVGTQILFCGWAFKFYANDQRAVTVLFASLFAAIFAAIPLVTPFERSTRFKGPSVTLMLLPLVNAAAYFLALYAMYEQDKQTLTWYALALAAVYLGISNAFKRRFTVAERKVINLIHIAIAIAFITIAIPLKLSHHWITMGWLVESAVLLSVAVRTKTDFLRYLAVAALVLGIFRLLAFPIHADRLILNARFATYAVAIAILGGIIYFGRRAASEKEQVFIAAAIIAFNALALTALTLEAESYFSRQEAQAYAVAGYSASTQQLWMARAFTDSAIWLVYGAGLMAAGFRNKSAFLRWQALVLIAITIVKVFFYDSRDVNTGYRVLSFIALGVVLLGISFVYFRIAARGEKPSSETPV
jgi:uncharacterized membrane protein